jgi:hypothetical protein
MTDFGKEQVEGRRFWTDGPGEGFLYELTGGKCDDRDFGMRSPDGLMEISHDEAEPFELKQAVVDHFWLSDALNQGYLTADDYHDMSKRLDELKKKGGAVFVVSENRIKTPWEYLKDGVTRISPQANVIMDEQRYRQAESERPEYQVTAISTEVKTDFSGDEAEVMENLPEFSTLLAMVAEMKQQGPDEHGHYFSKLLPKSQGQIWLLGKVAGDSEQPDILGVRIDREGRILIRTQDTVIERWPLSNAGMVKSSQSVWLLNKRVE